MFFQGLHGHARAAKLRLEKPKASTELNPEKLIGSSKLKFALPKGRMQGEKDFLCVFLFCDFVRCRQHFGSAERRRIERRVERTSSASQDPRYARSRHQGKIDFVSFLVLLPVLNVSDAQASQCR